jgi:hypothetical protein
MKLLWMLRSCWRLRQKCKAVPGSNGLYGVDEQKGDD